MADQLELDPRLYNPYAVADLAPSHPAVFAALQGWFGAVREFDDGAFEKLMRARAPEEIQRLGGAAEAVLAGMPQLASRLDPVIAALQEALAPAGSDARLEGLLEGARKARRELLERAPQLFAAAMRRAANADGLKAHAVELARTTVEALEAMAARSADGAMTFAELAPMVAELRRRLEDLHGAVAELPRQEARALQRDPKLAAASAALRRNLFAAKTRDRASGRLPLRAGARTARGPPTPLPSRSSPRTTMRRTCVWPHGFEPSGPRRLCGGVGRTRRRPLPPTITPAGIRWSCSSCGPRRSHRYRTR